MRSLFRSTLHLSIFRLQFHIESSSSYCMCVIVLPDFNQWNKWIMSCILKGFTGHVAKRQSEWGKGVKQQHFCCELDFAVHTTIPFGLRIYYQLLCIASVSDGLNKPRHWHMDQAQKATSESSNLTVLLFKKSHNRLFEYHFVYCHTQQGTSSMEQHKTNFPIWIRHNMFFNDHNAFY